MQQGIVFTWRRIAACMTAALIAAAAAVVMAQTGNDTAGASSLAGVTAELRQLRLAVEESTRSQTQTQALGVYISAQQSRLVQLATRVDAAKRELDALSLQTKQMTAELNSTEGEATRSTQPELRTRYEMQSRALKYELERLAPQLQQAQSREAELAHMLQTEEARWTDLIARLEQLVRQ